MATVQATPREKITPPQLPKAGACTLVIFGATGDLTRRKLLPALFDLACIGCMHKDFDVLGIGRTPLSDEDFRKQMHEATSKSKDARDFTDKSWQEFQKRLHYMEGDGASPEFY